MTTTAPEQVEAPQKGFAGESIPRKEDKRLVQGQGVFVDDVRRHEVGYVHFVRSPYAHAAITSIDVSAAEALEGVYGVLIGEEVAALTDPFFQLSVPPGSEIKDYALAVGKVRHLGDPVAAVAARTRELARDAAELVEVEYEPLPVVVDPEHALDEDAGVLHDEAGSNLVWSGEFDWGDFEAALDEADHVVRIDRLHFDRFSSTPLETSGAMVEYDRGTGQWTIHANNQFPGFAIIMMGARAPHRDGQAPLRLPGHRRRLRQQDLHPPAAGRALPARAQAQPPRAVDGVAHGPAHREQPRERTRLPRHRGAGQGGRDDARLQRARRSTTAEPSAATSRSAASSGRR